MDISYSFLYQSFKSIRFLRFSYGIFKLSLFNGNDEFISSKNDIFAYSYPLH